MTDLSRVAGAATRTTALPGWLSGLSLTQTYLLIGAFGLIGLALVVIGLATILRSGRRPARPRPSATAAPAPSHRTWES